VINGVKWAKCNLGASSPAGYGNIYTWDAAQSACPDGWRLPTYAEQESLLNAGSIWTSQNGVNGRIFGTAPNTIFLPAAGYYYNGSFYEAGTYGAYWSFTPGSSSGSACDLNFDSSTAYIQTSTKRIVEQSVRCVKE
jgi:uncharacterized protein (TIGR02145 family)